jgi:hypothetical protein
MRLLVRRLLTTLTRDPQIYGNQVISSFEQIMIVGNNKIIFLNAEFFKKLFFRNYFLDMLNFKEILTREKKCKIWVKT